MIVRRASKHDRVVAGGGAIEMEISKFLRNHSRTIKGKEQMLINAYAKALEVSSLFAKKILIIISIKNFLIHFHFFSRSFHNSCAIMPDLIRQIFWTNCARLTLKARFGLELTLILKVYLIISQNLSGSRLWLKLMLFKPLLKLLALSCLLIGPLKCPSPSSRKIVLFL